MSENGGLNEHTKKDQPLLLHKTRWLSSNQGLSQKGVRKENGDEFLLEDKNGNRVPFLESNDKKS